MNGRHEWEYTVVKKQQQQQQKTIRTDGKRGAVFGPGFISVGVKRRTNIETTWKLQGHTS